MEYVNDAYLAAPIAMVNQLVSMASRNRGQLPIDIAALKTLWLMICDIEDRRVAQKAKKAKLDIECNGYIEGAKATE